ncbi:hypothetical protein [Loktanella atrilutea]|uniref:hypothetical protein n=1 Tax=Loktanella atrilutea TaxID=366533 RepID=UPI000934F1D4|nr:hypothetical protein [Loktanella atrilutea]
MQDILTYFLKSDDGAVTVDWVVLTAAVVGLGLMAGLAVKPSVENKSNEIADSLAIAATYP